MPPGTLWLVHDAHSRSALRAGRVLDHSPCAVKDAEDLEVSRLVLLRFIGSMPDFHGILVAFGKLESPPVLVGCRVPVVAEETARTDRVGDERKDVIRAGVGGNVPCISLGPSVIRIERLVVRHDADVVDAHLYLVGPRAAVSSADFDLKGAVRGQLETAQVVPSVAVVMEERRVVCPPNRPVRVPDSDDHRVLKAQVSGVGVLVQQVAAVVGAHDFDQVSPERVQVQGVENAPARLGDLSASVQHDDLVGQVVARLAGGGPFGVHQCDGGGLGTGRDHSGRQRSKPQLHGLAAVLDGVVVGHHGEGLAVLAGAEGQALRHPGPVVLRRSVHLRGRYGNDRLQGCRAVELNGDLCAAPPFGGLIGRGAEGHPEGVCDGDGCLGGGPGDHAVRHRSEPKTHNLAVLIDLVLDSGKGEGHLGSPAVEGHARWHPRVV